MTSIKLICFSFFGLIFFLVLAGIILLGLRITGFVFSNKNKAFNMRDYYLLCYPIILIGMCSGVLIVSLFIGCLWWAYEAIMTHFAIEKITPSGIAISSIIFGVSPLAFTSLGLVLSKLFNCSVDASRHDDVYILNINIGPFIYFLFMSFYFCFFTLPVMFLGLMSALVMKVVQFF